MSRDRDVDQFVRIANRLGLADDVRLLQRLRALANENVTCLPRKIAGGLQHSKSGGSAVVDWKSLGQKGPFDKCGTDTHPTT